MITYAFTLFALAFAPPLPLSLGAAALTASTLHQRGRQAVVESAAFLAPSALHPAATSRVKDFPRADNAHDVWAQVSIGGSPVNDLVLRGELAVAVGPAGLWRSDDGGRSWRRDPRGDAGLDDCGSMALRLVGDDVAFRCERYDRADWCRLLPPPPAAPLPCTAVTRPAGPSAVGARGARRAQQRKLVAALGLEDNLVAEGLSVARDGPRVLVGHPFSGVYRSEDGGETWRFSSDGMSGLAAIALGTERAGDILAVRVTMAAPISAVSGPFSDPFVAVGELVCAPGRLDVRWRCSWRHPDEAIDRGPFAGAPIEPARPVALPRDFVSVIPQGLPRECDLFDLWPGGPRSSFAATSCGLMVRAR